MKQIVFALTIGFSLVKIWFFISFGSKYLGFTVLANQSFKVSTVNFNSTKNNSAKEVEFLQAKTANVASLS